MYSNYRRCIQYIQLLVLVQKKFLYGYKYFIFADVVSIEKVIRLIESFRRKLLLNYISSTAKHLLHFYDILQFGEN